MIVDSSAMMAIILDEPDARLMLHAMEGAPTLQIGAPTLVELRMAAESRRGPDAVLLIAELLADLEIEVTALTEAHAEAAHAAWRRFGRRTHPAALNLGDTYSYALAKVSGEPLLFKGDDFRQTDIASAL